ncbi:MAG: FecR domain-containing protein [Dehalococcoidia bacterium]
MPNKTPFRLNRSGLLLALISTAFAGQAQAAAGRVEFAIGPATVVGANGQTRPATRGTEVDTGDTVRTQQGGRVQVRMADGAYISLQPNTEFGIKDYKFEGKTDGSENAFYSLLKGAMRTVTGLIGRVNRNKYLVSTPTATVGIRGTGGLIQVQDDGSTLVQGTSGIWFLANPAGTIDIPAGVSGVAPTDPNQPPQETTDVPTSGPAPLPPQQEFAQGEEREPDGDNVITTTTKPVLVSGSGYAVTNAFGYSSNFPGIESGTGADATFDSSGQMTSVTVNNTTFSLNGGTHANFGTDGILAWGRWTGPISVVGSWCEGTCSNTNYSTNQGLHYVVGMPTPSMPQSGTATYALLGATQPTYIDGSASPGTFDGTLSVSFDARLPSVALNLNIGIDGNGYAIGGNAPISGSSFTGSVSFGQGTLSVTGTTSGACFSGCNALVEGLFAGSSAERAGLGYHIDDVGNGKDIIGAAAFAKQ